MRTKILSLSTVLVFLSACQCGVDDSSSAGTDGYSQVVVQEEVKVTDDQGAGSVVVMPVQDRVFYGFDKYKLTAEAQKVVESQVAWLKENPALAVSVEGHCDERGTREYNLALGERRANGVKDYMVSLGVEPARITTISYGKDKPTVPGSNKEAWAKNRTSITVAHQ
jgi:peptidoglycan-associated lipoprotein